MATKTVNEKFEDATIKFVESIETFQKEISEIDGVDDLPYGADALYEIFEFKLRLQSLLRPFIDRDWK